MTGDPAFPDDVITTANRGAAASVSALVEAGLPLESGLRALSEEVPSRRLRRTLRRMSDELAAGVSADEVLSRDGSGLPRYVRGLVRSGVRTGQLGSFLEEFLVALRRRRWARRSFWMALAYPVLLLPLSVLAALGLLGLVVPQFKDIFNDFGVELPWLTIVLIGIGDVVTVPVLMGLLVFVLGALVVLPFVPYAYGPAVWTRHVQRLPLIGRPSRMRGMSEFCSLLGLLVSGRIPLPEALEITSGVMQDANLRAGARRLAEQMAGGASLREAAGRLPNFSAELRSLFHWEPRGQAFGEILRQAGSVFSARSQVQLGMVGLIFQPLVLVLVGSFIALTIVALFMPLIKLLNELS